MSDSDLDLDLEELSSAEEFLEYFSVPFEAAVVHVNRLHILQRFHDYITAQGDMPEDDYERHAVYRELLIRAYEDFVISSARDEKVFRVFKMHEPPQASVSVADLLAG